MNDVSRRISTMTANGGELPESYLINLNLTEPKSPEQRRNSMAEGLPYWTPSVNPGLRNEKRGQGALTTGHKVHKVQQNVATVPSYLTLAPFTQAE